MKALTLLIRPIIEIEADTAAGIADDALRYPLERKIDQQAWPRVLFWYLLAASCRPTDVVGKISKFRLSDICNQYEFSTKM